MTPAQLDIVQSHAYQMQKVTQPYGFCERFPLLAQVGSPVPRSSIGLWFFVQNPQNLVLGILDKIFTFNGYLNRKARGLTNRLFLKSSMKMYNIPFRFWGRFFLQEDMLIDADFARKQKELNGSITKLNLNYFTTMNNAAYKTDQHRISALETNIIECPEADQTYLLYYAEIDTLGHRFGPDSVQVRTAVSKCLTLFFDLVERHPGHSFYLVGDHGMAPVEDVFDFQSALKSALEDTFRAGKDYIYFCDSTFCRIWCASDAVCKEIHARLSVDSAILAAGMLKFVPTDQTEGDTRPFLLFSIRRRMMIWPDFFHYSDSQIPKGMHGHLENDDYLAGVFLRPQTKGHNGCDPIDISNILSEVWADPHG